MYIYIYTYLYLSIYIYIYIYIHTSIYIRLIVEGIEGIAGWQRGLRALPAVCRLSFSETKGDNLGPEHHQPLAAVVQVACVCALGVGMNVRCVCA